MLRLRITISLRKENHTKVHRNNVHYDVMYKRIQS